MTAATSLTARLRAVRASAAPTAGYELAASLRVAAVAHFASVSVVLADAGARADVDALGRCVGALYRDVVAARAVIARWSPADAAAAAELCRLDAQLHDQAALAAAVLARLRRFTGAPRGPR